MTRISVLLQWLAPQHLLSRLAGRMARSEIKWFKNALILAFCKKYKVDMSEAQLTNPTSYRSFNAFFTRALRADARPITNPIHAVACPADGTVSQCGHIHSGRILQAKKHWFSCAELLGGEDIATAYDEGFFTTIYLAPSNYHRVHMPLNGSLREIRYIPGRLFSVNAATTEQLPRLFARNERLVCRFDSEEGEFMLVMVGAMIVAGIETVWEEPIFPGRAMARHMQPPHSFMKGEELGRFLLGSTVILLCSSQVVWSKEAKSGAQVVMGQKIGLINNADQPPEAI